jgi:methyltransferase-like protein
MRFLRCYAAGHVELSVQASPSVRKIPKRPRVSRLARHQALAGSEVTNLWHVAVPVSGLTRHLLRYLDGQAGQSALLQLLEQDVRSGRLVVHDDDRAVLDDEGTRQILQEGLLESLEELVRLGLLMLPVDD